MQIIPQEYAGFGFLAVLGWFAMIFFDVYETGRTEYAKVCYVGR
jgi:hypothetical protein